MFKYFCPGAEPRTGAFQEKKDDLVLGESDQKIWSLFRASGAAAFRRTATLPNARTGSTGLLVKI